MLGLDLTGKFKTFAPYAVIAYLLFGGSNTTEFADIDNTSAAYVLEQIDSKTPAKGIKDQYLSYLPKKTHVNLPSEANLPQNSLGDFIRKAMEYPKKFLNSNKDNYGY